MRFRTRVTFQVQDTTTRSASGDVLPVWTNAPAPLDDVPATIVPVTTEQAGDLMDPTEDIWDVIVGGDHRDIATSWRILDGAVAYEVVRIAPTLTRRTTVVRARRMVP